MDTQTGELIPWPVAKNLIEEAKKTGADPGRYKPAPFVTKEMLGRGRVLPNEPCPCGSGVKFKKCCRRKGPSA